MKRNGNISESGKKLILGIGILLILAIIVIVLVVRMKDDVRKRDAVVETLQQEIPEDGEGQAESGSETEDGREAARQENAADSETEDGSVQVGALEDEEDPQEQKAAEAISHKYLLILLIAHYFEGFNVWMALRTSL